MSVIIHPRPGVLGYLLLIGCALLGSGPVPADSDQFTSGALRGVSRVQVVVEGISADFARYGLSSAQVLARTETRLTTHGLTVLDATQARDDPAASQFRVRLIAHENPYALLSYLLSAELRRKVPLDAQGRSYVSETVWSRGRSGVLNPSDLQRIYGFVDGLVDQFIAAHSVQNGPAQTADDL